MTVNMVTLPEPQSGAKRPKLEKNVFGQVLHFTPLFIGDFVDILPKMYIISHIMVSRTF
jgi:hypothetical protein